MTSVLQAPSAGLTPRPTWKIPPTPDPAAVRALRQSLGLPHALCRLLAARGHLSAEAARSFLRPLLGTLHPPDGLLDAPGAARRLARAVSEREQVVVHGDFDVDGISGAALLASWIRALGGRAAAIVPDRLRDGYDLSLPGVDRAAALGAAVLVTVDCGIVANEAVRRAARAGMDVIVTDHHRPGAALPRALAVVNPNRPGCPYPNKHLCGAAVAFKVGQLLAAELGRPEEESWEYLDLVALATVADQVALTGENRVLARYGLRAFAHRARPGLVALMRSAGVPRDAEVDSATVAFALGPRINAAGRVGDADEALRLLMTDDRREARELAEKLDDHNRRRRALDQHTTEEAMKSLQLSYDPERDRAAVVSGEGWHRGVIGIVASRLAERIFRPVVVLSLEGDSGRGSARSVPSFDLHAALSSCSEHLDRFGGHHQAAGMDIARGRLPAFREAFLAAARRGMGSGRPVPEIRADLEIGLCEAGPGLFRYLRYVGPFGQGNPDPVFVAHGAALAEPPKLLKGGHVKFRLTQDGASLPAIGFGLADRLPLDDLKRGPVDVAFNLIESTFRGHTTIEAKVLDIRPAA